jgi:hypothetical protein
MRHSPRPRNPTPDLARDSRAAGFFRSSAEAFRRAARTAGASVDRYYRLDGHSLRLRFASAAPASVVMPALEHLAAGPDGAPALTVWLWDTRSTGVGMPPPPWPVDGFVRAKKGWRLDGPRYRISHEPGSGAFQLLDKQRRLAIVHWTAADRLPQYERGSPLLALLQWWMDRRRVGLIHAAAVGTEEGGVLLVGRGGSGKSTAALACLSAGLRYVGDDYCLLSFRPGPYVSSLYNSAKVSLDQVDRFPLLKPSLSAHSDPESGKALCFIHRCRPSSLWPGFPVRAVLVPRVTGRPGTTLQSISPARAMLAVAPSSIFHFQGQADRALRRLGRLVKQVPCYALDAGTDLAGIAETVRGLQTGSP